jgi:hypothetical protein
MRNIFQVKVTKYSATQGENHPISNSSWSTRQPAEISYRIQSDTLEHWSVGILRHTGIDEADKTCLRDVRIQLDIDSVARLRIFIWLIHPVALY